MFRLFEQFLFARRSKKYYIEAEVFTRPDRSPLIVPPDDAMKPTLPLFASLLLAFSVPSLKAADAWFADTRPGAASFSRLEADAWMPSTDREFLETFDSAAPLVVVVHGNWMSLAEAKAHGKVLHQRSRNIGPHRLLVWSWPSDRIGTRLRQDVQTKASRADAQSKHLIALLRSLPADSRVSLVGFSFGAKLVCNALQNYGEESSTHRIRTVLLAAAMDQASLQPGNQYGNALAATEKMLVHVNRFDSRLRFYPLLNGCGGPEAVGREGINRHGMSAEAMGKIRSVSVNRLIGSKHGFMNSLATFLACRNDFKAYALFLGD